MDNPIIAKRFKEKMARIDKTSQSILTSWATNCAIATLSETNKNNFGEELLAEIKTRRDIFIDMYREWMLDNEPEPEMSNFEKTANQNQKYQDEGETRRQL